MGNSKTYTVIVYWHETPAERFQGITKYTIADNLLTLYKSMNGKERHSVFPINDNMHSFSIRED